MTRSSKTSIKAFGFALFLFLALPLACQKTAELSLAPVLPQGFCDTTTAQEKYHNLYPAYQERANTYNNAIEAYNHVLKKCADAKVPAQICDQILSINKSAAARALDNWQKMGNKSEVENLAKTCRH